MIATASLLLFFLILGAAVFFVALSGGPKGAAEDLHRQGKGRSRFRLTLTLVVMVAFGAGIPVAVIAANQDNQSKQAPGGVELTAAQQAGRQVFAKNCSTCHTLKSANAVGRVGPNLDVIPVPVKLTIDAIKNGRARGMGQMPAGLVDGKDAKDVASYVAATAGRD